MISHTAQLRALLDRLAPLAAQAEVAREYWLTTLGASEIYCEDCARLAQAPRSLRDPEGEHELDGGYDIHEQDSTPCCATCHILLEYTLTNAGAEDELAFYLSADRPDTLTPETAYELCRLLEAYDMPQAPLALHALLAWLETVVSAAVEEPSNAKGARV